MDKALIRKYNVPGPRYTSYPTVPYWNEAGIDPQDWISTVKKSFEESQDQGISLYIHLPFCESLCTFCGCHKRITKNHGVETPYIDTVLQEWKLYLDVLGNKPLIQEIHLGGGTPTFFSPEELERMITGILETSKVASNFEFGFEGHPNNTTREHLQTLYDLGFRRVSFGVQDYAPKVQDAINRIQSFEQVKEVHDMAREMGYTSISHDLVFGLPFQTLDDVRDTINKTRELRPDRLSFYSYAHVPWVKGVGQRKFDESDLPLGKAKSTLYERGKELLEEAGYVEIGMDHFSLTTDTLYQAWKDKKLHRNFMGYTTNTTQLMIGLGMSSISDSWYAFAQNEKKVEDYQNRVAEGKIPIFRGHLLTDEDRLIRQKILDVMCHFATDFSSVGRGSDQVNFPEDFAEKIKERLTPLIGDGLLQMEENELLVNDLGKPFVRNICMCFDERLHRNKPETQLFSMTV
ncbi:oxygen-independent coproporphyrinogen III oxidase [bacterium SCSIO 12741]|nr:oxygen-independent coproporphyrinogen III oxidase [bacterium SCSIO 12741]